MKMKYKHGRWIAFLAVAAVVVASQAGAETYVAEMLGTATNDVAQIKEGSTAALKTMFPIGLGVAIVVGLFGAIITLAMKFSRKPGRM